MGERAWPDSRRMAHVIRLPDGRNVTVGEYVRSWRKLKTLDPMRLVSRFGHFPLPAQDILRTMHWSVHDRVNRHIVGYGQGRKWRESWQVETTRLARALNTPRLIIRWMPMEWRQRFGDRLYTDE